MAELDALLACGARWAGTSLAIATVVKTWGSAPRPVGSHMLVRADGAFEGSVSGGCVENDVIAAAALLATSGGSSLLSFGVTDDESWVHGLPCGGTIEIFIKSVDPDHFPPALFDELAAARSLGTAFTTSTHFPTGRTVAGMCSGSFIHVYEPPRRMLIVGAVQIAQPLCRFARELDFDVTLERFPDIRHDDRWPDDAICQARPDSFTAIVTLSHDPKLDDPALIAALAHPTGYIAALGSTRSHQARLKRLRTHGVPESALRRIDGPAGIALGGRGVSEIALSIAAGAVKRLNEGLHNRMIEPSTSMAFGEPVLQAHA